MNKVLEKVDLLEDKLTQLILKQEQLIQENSSLRQKEQNLLTTLVEKTEFIKGLEEKQATLKIANAMVGSREDKHLTKIKINSLIRDIDKCIAQLSE